MHRGSFTDDEFPSKQTHTQISFLKHKMGREHTNTESRMSLGEAKSSPSFPDTRIV